jgi:adenylate cyclase
MTEKSKFELESLLRRVPFRRVDLLISAVVTLIALAVYAYVATGATTRSVFSFIQNVELRSLDARFRMRGTRPHDPRIVIVGIDEKTLHAVGSWPIARSAYAQLVDKLSEGGAKVVAFDVTFPTPEKNSAVEAMKRLEAEVGPSVSPAVIARIREIQASSDNDRALAESMKRANNVVLGHIFLDEQRSKSIDEKAAEDYFNVIWARPFPQMQKVKSGSRDFDLNEAWCQPRDGVCTNGEVFAGIESNIRLLAEAAKSYGYFNDVPDADGTFRRAALVVRYRDRDFYPSLGFQVVREYEDIKDQNIVGYLAENGLERIEFGPHNLKTGRDASMLINFAGPAGTYEHISMADVLSGAVAPSSFKDKIVLVGGTAVGIGDLRITPYQSSDYMGVEIHANIIDNLLHAEDSGRGFLHRGFNEEMIDIVFILLFGFGLGLAFGRVKPLYSTISVLVALAVFGAIAFFAFAKLGLWLNVVIPASALVLNYASITSYRMIFEEREKRKVRKTFERYVSPGVIRLIEKDPRKYFRAGGELKDLSIMFSDIRSFTTIAEGLTPDELVYLLNDYLGEMTDIVFKRWGTLDKYIGDALMAFWGSPFPQEDHALRACGAALDMSARLEELNLKWEVEGRRTLKVGIGINSGPVNVGNMGSSRRFAWTVMGDGVNLASRLEGLTKQYRVERIISEFTYAQVKDHFVCRELDRIRVKGKLQPVAIYELVAFAKDASRHQEFLHMYANARGAYHRHAWDEAARGFELVLSKYPEDGPSQVFLQRSLEFRREAPAPDWDGVYVMKWK